MLKEKAVPHGRFLERKSRRRERVDAAAGQRNQRRVSAFGAGDCDNDCRLAGSGFAVVLVADGNALYGRTVPASGSVAYGFSPRIDFAAVREALVRELAVLRCAGDGGGVCADVERIDGGFAGCRAVYGAFGLRGRAECADFVGADVARDSFPAFGFQGRFADAGARVYFEFRAVDCRGNAFAENAECEFGRNFVVRRAVPFDECGLRDGAFSV